MAEQVCFNDALEQRVYFRIRENIPRFDCGFAGHGCQHPLESAASSSAPFTSESFQNIEEQILRRTASGKCRYRAQDPGCGAEIPHRKTHVLKFLKVGFD